MRKTTMKFLLATSLLACKGDSDGVAVELDLSSNESLATRSANTAHDEGEGEGEGTGTAMALEEGKLGKAEGQRSRRQAIEQARAAGVLGSGRYGTIGAGGGGLASLTGTADFGNRGDTYRDYGKNPWTDATKDRLSTFAADVDTASYTLARRVLGEGALPVPAAVRVEEFVNYFRYELGTPAAGSPFAVVMDAAPSPLVPGRHVVRVGVATRAKAASERQPANLVFLVDTSGSMAGSDRLALAKRSLKLLLGSLDLRDTVALVTYAGDTKLVLPATGMAAKSRIVEAIDALGAGGSTAMGSGIELAYREAAKGLGTGATSRVIVLSDGDANVGPTSHEEILKLIERHAKEGVTVSTIGFGVGNYRDDLMEQLADKGNGNNYYIDDIDAAKRVFQDRVVSTLEVVAKDAKLQVDFDPAMVARYRLLGYENRDVADKDFRNDKVDAGEIGAGHQVVAMYEVELTAAGKQANASLGSVRIRHKEPRGVTATEAAFPMAGGPAATFAAASQDLRFAFAVAAFADVLRGGADSKKWSLAAVRDLAKAAAGGDADRKQLVDLIDRAIALRGKTS